MKNEKNILSILHKAMCSSNYLSKIKQTHLKLTSNGILNSLWSADDERLFLIDYVNTVFHLISASGAY